MPTNGLCADRRRNELMLARDLQSEMLPVRHPPEANWDISVKCAAAHEVGGDFYDFFRYSSKAVSAEALGDVSGKGPAAAIYAALVVGILRSFAPAELGPAEMLVTLNRALLQRPVQGRYVSMIYATWDERHRVFRISNAGLPYPVCVRNGKASSLQAAGLPLGLFEDAEYEEHLVVCDPGDLVVFYTDGVTDAINADDEDFGQDRLEQVLKAHASSTASQVVDAVFGEVASHTAGMEAFDDQTVIAFRT